MIKKANVVIFMLLLFSCKKEYEVLVTDSQRLHNIEYYIEYTLKKVSDYDIEPTIMSLVFINHSSEDYNYEGYMYLIDGISYTFFVEPKLPELQSTGVPRYDKSKIKYQIKAHDTAKIHIPINHLASFGTRYKYYSLDFTYMNPIENNGRLDTFDFPAIPIAIR